MKVITDKKQISKLHNKLMQKLEEYSSEKILALTGHKGNSFEKEVNYSDELDLWWDMGGFSEGKSGVRYWNAFGINKPKPKRLANIICEINYPKEGINKRVAANWIQIGKDYLLVHSGKIGGGRKGIGKNGFIEHYNGAFEEIDMSDLPNEVTIIGNLKDKSLPYQIKNFVYEVARIKDLLVNKETSITSSESSNPLEKIKHSFNEEFVGTKEYKHRKGKISSTANHGLVVNNLKKLIEEKGNLVANDQQRDLYIYNEKAKIETVFEVKTSLKSQSIFTAVGQLFVNNARLNPLPRLIYVIPERPNKNLSKTLNKLNIETLVYKLSDGKTNFYNLDKYI